jgi:hypothetical protein
MTPFGLLILVAVVIVVVAVSGLRPRGTRPVGRTGLMTAARIVLVLLAIVVLYVMFGRS